MTPVKIPRYIDAPMQIAFWEVDELFPLLLLFAIGLSTKTLTYMWVPMYLVTKMYQKYKSTSRRGALFHWLWWMGFYSLGTRFSNGLIRLYVG